MFTAERIETTDDESFDQVIDKYAKDAIELALQSNVAPDDPIMAGLFHAAKPLLRRVTCKPLTHDTCLALYGAAEEVVRMASRYVKHG